MLTILPCHLSG